MKREEYLKYSDVEFSADPQFLQWRMTGTQEVAAFWNAFMEAHPEKKATIESAIRIVDSVRMNRCDLTRAEMTAELARLQAAIGRPRRNRRLARVLWGAAAACVAATVSVALLQRQAASPADQVAALIARTSTENVRLELAGDRVMELDGDADIVYDRAGGIRVNAQEPVASGQGGEAVMNRLIVPGGKRSSLTLADGSRMWVNAGTTVEFPSSFADDRREIRVCGEVYLEVAPDAAKPFYVNADALSVRVTGTKFNVSAYPEDPLSSVVLVEGSVSVDLPEGKSVPMRPDDRLTLRDYRVQLEKVNTADYISWVDGTLNYHGESLKRVLAALSRYYNVPLEGHGIEDVYIWGRLVLFDELHTVLDNITVIAPVKYGVQNEKITITK